MNNLFMELENMPSCIQRFSNSAEINKTLQFKHHELGIFILQMQQSHFQG